MNSYFLNTLEILIQSGAIKRFILSSCFQEVDLLQKNYKILRSFNTTKIIILIINVMMLLVISVMSWLVLTYRKSFLYALAYGAHNVSLGRI